MGTEQIRVLLYPSSAIYSLRSSIALKSLNFLCKNRERWCGFANCYFSFFVFFKYIEAVWFGLVKYGTSIIHFIIYGFYPFYDIYSLKVWYSHMLGSIFLLILVGYAYYVYYTTFIFRSWVLLIIVYLFYCGGWHFWIFSELICAFHKSSLYVFPPLPAMN